MKKPTIRDYGSNVDERETCVPKQFDLENKNVDRVKQVNYEK